VRCTTEVTKHKWGIYNITLTLTATYIRTIQNYEFKNDRIYTDSHNITSPTARGEQIYLLLRFFYIVCSFCARPKNNNF